MSGMLLIGDIHAGVKSTVEHYVKYQEKEFDKAIQYAKKHNIKRIVFLGDIFNDRKNIYIPTLQLIKRKFEELSKTDIKFYIIIGNHDAFYKNTNGINSPKEVFGHLNPKKIKIIDKECLEEIIDGKSFTFVPWITKDVFDKTVKYIKNSSADYCLGHFEINGFVMNNTNLCKNNFRPSIFSEFKQVFSGHFHTKSSSKNILYTGSLCEIDWSDFGVDKGFYHLDIPSGKLKFIKSDTKIFRKVLIGKTFNFDDIDIINSFLKIYINRKMTTKERTQLGDLISKNISYEIIDNTILNDIDSDDTTFESEDFHDIVKACVEIQEINDTDKADIISFINKQYNDMKIETK